MTARYPRKIFTTEFEQQEIADIGLILDARTSTGNDVWDAALFDFSITATASLAEVFLHEGNRVGLLVFGEEITPLFPGVGKRQLNSIYRCLANARVGREIPLEYIDYFPSRLLPSRSLIFMISPLSLHDGSEYQRLAVSGYQVILLSPDPIRFAARKFPADQVNSLAVRLALVERHLQLDRLLRLGIQVIDWPVDRSLDEALHTVLNPLNNARFKSKAGL